VSGPRSGIADMSHEHPEPSGVPTSTIQGLPVSLLALQDAVSLITEWAASARARLVVTPNTDHFLRWMRDASFRALYRRADLRTVDGAPLVALARAQGVPTPPRVTGADLFTATAASAAAVGIPLVIIGGGPGIAHLAGRRLEDGPAGARVAFTDSPRPQDLLDEEYVQRLARRLAELPTKVVALCLGSPKQEQLFADLERVEVVPFSGVYLCVGATVDFLAGRVTRSPFFLRRLGLEWLFRLALEPRRLWRRYLVDDVRILRYFVRAARGRLARASGQRAAAGSAE
jgi:N-acetylglucosaminyldiphosphoundecaprenol N-acetyl-beta-D-mannosaminyltransferase